MKAVLRFVCAALVAVLCAPAAFAAHTHVPTPSEWTLNVAKSDFGGGPSMKSDVFFVSVDTEKWLKFTDVTVDGDGKKSSTSWSGPQDGTTKPMEGMKGATMSTRTADDTSHTALPDGSMIDSVIMLSADKKVVTFTQTVKTKDGKSYKQKLVYDRTK